MKKLCKCITKDKTDYHNSYMSSKLTKCMKKSAINIKVLTMEIDNWPDLLLLTKQGDWTHPSQGHGNYH